MITGILIAAALVGGTVGGDQRKIHTQTLVQCRHRLFQEHLNQLYKSGDHQNKYDGLHIFHSCSHQHKFINQTGTE